MKEQRQYNLKEAIKNLYATEPLKADLATTVADKVFAKNKKNSAAFDTWLYVFIGILIVSGIVYSFNFLDKFALSYAMLIIISILIYFSLSFKEYLLIHKRLLL